MPTRHLDTGCGPMPATDPPGAVSLVGDNEDGRRLLPRDSGACPSDLPTGHRFWSPGSTAGSPSSPTPSGGTATSASAGDRLASARPCPPGSTPAPTTASSGSARWAPIRPPTPNRPPGHCRVRPHDCVDTDGHRQHGLVDPLVHTQSAASGLTELLIVDEADRVKTTGLEQIRDYYDRHRMGVIYIGLSGIEGRLVRYPQLYSRIGSPTSTGRSTPTSSPP